jgi:hypothetical protein
VGAGIQKSSIQVEGNHFFARRPSSESSSLLPAVAVGINFIPNPNTARLLFRLQAGYHTTKSITTGSSVGTAVSVYELNMSSVSLRPSIILNIYNKPNFKIPVGVSFGYIINKYSKNILSENYSDVTVRPVVVRNNYFDLQKGNVTPLVQAGVIVYKKVEISAMYQLPIAITSNSAYSVSNSLLQLQALYYLW